MCSKNYQSAFCSGLDFAREPTWIDPSPAPSPPALRIGKHMHTLVVLNIVARAFPNKSRSFNED